MWKNYKFLINHFFIGKNKLNNYSRSEIKCGRKDYDQAFALCLSD
jgi:hypothetical protein